MDGEPIDLDRTFGGATVRRWRHDGTHMSQVTFVAVGTLPDGRWFAQGERGQGWAYPDEAAAQRAAEALMARRTGWVTIDPDPGPGVRYGPRP